MIKKILQSSVFWIVVIIILFYGWSSGRFDFLHKSSTETPPTTGYGGITINKDKWIADCITKKPVSDAQLKSYCEEKWKQTGGKN